MAQRRKMSHRLPDAIQIIDANIADARPWRFDFDEHGRQVAKLEILEQRFFHFERHDRHAFDSVFQHRPHRSLHALGIANCGSQ